MDLGLPTKSEAFLQGQDIFYAQFNEVNFYVEDEDQENLYFDIIKKLFPNLKFVKIFPLCGKRNVKSAARATASDKSKIYIVDLDFDGILNRKENLPNLFYLERYSIENYLLEEHPLLEVVLEEKPKLKLLNIKSTFEMKAFLKECRILFEELLCHFLVIQEHNLGIENTKGSPLKFCSFTPRPSIKTSEFSRYRMLIDNTLKDKQLNLEEQIQKYKNHLASFQEPEDVVNIIPGKYVLAFLKHRIESLFSIPSMTLESFTYRLTKKSELNSLFSLQQSIILYIEH